MVMLVSQEVFKEGLDRVGAGTIVLNFAGIPFGRWWFW